jgi:hypothetical protein
MRVMGCTPRLRWTRRCYLALVVTLVGGFLVALVASTATSDTSGAVPSAARQYGGGRLLAADPSGGYWTATPSGDVEPHANALQLGSPSSSGDRLNQPIVGMTGTASGGGYWLVASDGGIFSYGDARFFGSTGSVRLNQPIVGMAATPDGGGYWLVASDGGIFSYGDARFFGSTGSVRLNQPIVGMAATPDGDGYWLLASDGGIFSYGDAAFFGSTGSIQLDQPIVGMAATPDNGGYWMVASDGGVFTFGDALYYGSLGGTGSSVLGMVVAPSSGGYGLVTANGGEQTFGPIPPPATSASGALNPTTSTSASTTTTTIPPAATTTTTTTQDVAAPMTTGYYEADIQGGPSSDDCAPTTLPTVTPDASLDSLVDNQSGPGWIGGDAGFSTDLPNGQEAFVFGDTLAGTAAEDGQITNFKGLVDDSELVGTMPDLESNLAGTPSAPTGLLPDTENPDDGWQIGATYMEDGQQLVFVQELTSQSGSIYGTYTGRSAIAILSLASGTPTLSSVEDVPTDRWTQWGNAMVQSGGYDYIYGIDFNTDAGIWYGLKVARAPVGQTLDLSQWTYWNGSSWVSGEPNAAVTGTPLVNGIIPLENASGFMGVGVGGSGSDYYLYLTFSCSPTGPWSWSANAYTIPETATYSDEIAYMATFHPELTADGLVASYSIDSSNGLSSLEQDDHEYQPRFVDITP